jgi:alginate O-acetyltransferase complex protein AlgJ
MSLDAAPASLRPSPDIVRSVAYPKPKELGGLLDDTPPPRITLVGTSFSRNGQFDEALAAAFGQPVLNVARSGGGFAEAASAYFASAAFRDTPPSLIIWEIPERVLGQPISPDEAVFLRKTE